MPPRHHVLIARALFPPVRAMHGALHKASGAGSMPSLLPDDMIRALTKLQLGDQRVADNLRRIEQLANDPDVSEDEIFRFGTGVDSELSALIEAFDDCRAADGKLSEIAHETLVIYAQLFAETLIALSKPTQLISEGAAVAQGDDQYIVNLSGSTKIPERIAELPGWVGQPVAYDESRIRLALQYAQEARTAHFIIEPSAPPAPPPAASKGLSFWEILGVIGLFSLFTGHDHDD